MSLPVFHPLNHCDDCQTLHDDSTSSTVADLMGDSEIDLKTKLSNTGMGFGEGQWDRVILVIVSVTVSVPDSFLVRSGHGFDP